MATNKVQSHLASERGAVIVQVAIALVGLLAMSTFVIDYGVLWAARRQAQNAADAAAMAGAISLAFVDFNNQGLARQSALDVAGQNNVWGAAPDVTPADVTFPACPPGSPGAGTNSCIRVDLFRNQRAGGNPLPTFFGQLVGVANQGVRATATAEALFGDSTDCVKPFAIPDKWLELRDDKGPAGWSEEDDFSRYDKNGNLLPGPKPVDFYSADTGYTPASIGPGGGDYGRYTTLKFGNPHDATAPGWYQLVVLDGNGGAPAENWIANCYPGVIGPGTTLTIEPGGKVGPVKHGMEDLIAKDPDAYWDPNLNGTGRGGIRGGCMASGACTVSPRLVAIPVYDPNDYDIQHNASGRVVTLNITKVLGFFMDRMQGNEVNGYIMTYPATPNAGMGGVPGAADFVVSVALVR